MGHIAFECPNRRVVTLVDYDQQGDMEEEPEEVVQEEEGGQEEEVLEEELGKCLVLRRALSSRPVEVEQLQKESIFHTRCNVQGKVCTMIIDGGSCANVASQTMVSKLSLPTKPHPTPYVIQWLNQGKGLHV